MDGLGGVVVGIRLPGSLVDESDLAGDASDVVRLGSSLGKDKNSLTLGTHHATLRGLVLVLQVHEASATGVLDDLPSVAGSGVLGHLDLNIGVLVDSEVLGSAQEIKVNDLSLLGVGDERGEVSSCEGDERCKFHL